MMREWSIGGVKTDRRKPEELGEKLAPVPLCLSQIPNKLFWKRTWISAVRSWSLNA
jgi:hypothetical protein